MGKVQRPDQPPAIWGRWMASGRCAGGSGDEKYGLRIEQAQGDQIRCRRYMAAYETRGECCCKQKLHLI